MAQTFFFYDLETSGTSAASQRIMQFAGLRTNLELEPIGEPVNLLVKLSDDILPEPDAILVHGITPQQSIQNGLTEPELLKLLEQQVFTKDTILTGFNNIRFDDEFMRHTLWRNFYDPYEWHYKDGRSRWDLLDVSRMTRALRPDGINWPVDESGEPTNRLGALTAANNIAHANAHDALSDIQATVELARLIKSQQPKLFAWLFGQRDKRVAANTIGYDLNGKKATAAKPFIYTSGRYPGANLKTTVATVLAPYPGDSNSVLVYDLRHDPRPFGDMSLSELRERLFVPYEERESRPPLPVKKLALNKSPAVAPVSTLDKSTQQRISLTPTDYQTNLKYLAQLKGFAQLVYDAYDSQPDRPVSEDPERQLYSGGFLSPADQALARSIRLSEPDKLADWHPNFTDERLGPLLLRYKARNYPNTLSEKEAITWESWRSHKLISGLDGGINLSRFGKRLAELAVDIKGADRQFLLEELQLYGQSIAPAQLFDVD